MVDNVQLNAGSGGDVIATDDLAGIQHQLVKIEFGIDSSAQMVSSTAPLPVSSTGVVVSGTVAISNPTTSVSALITNTSSTAIWIRSTDVTITNPTTAVSISAGATAVSVQAIEPLDKLYLATGSSYAINYAKIAISTTGNQTLVTNTGAGIKVTVLSLAVISKLGADFYIQDGATNILFGSSVAMVGLSSQGGFILPHNPKGWFQTGSSANLLLFNNTVGSTLAGSLTYALSS